MSALFSPLLFPETLKSPGLWAELGRTHGLSSKDFDWLAHIELATQALRSEQVPPMLAQRILLNTDESPAEPLVGSFILGATPNDRGEILYTPYEGIKKHYSRADLVEQLEKRLNSSGDAERLLAFLPISRRKRLLDSAAIRVTFETISGDVFDDQQALIRQAQRVNAEAMLVELQQLPSLNALLEQVMDGLLGNAFPGLQHRLTRVNFISIPTTIKPDTGWTP